MRVVEQVARERIVFAKERLDLALRAKDGKKATHQLKKAIELLTWAVTDIASLEREAVK